MNIPKPSKLLEAWRAWCVLLVIPVNVPRLMRNLVHMVNVAARVFELKCLLERFRLSNAASSLLSVLDIARYDASELVQPALVGGFNKGSGQCM